MSAATDMLAAYMAAEQAVLQGLSVRMGDRQLTRAELPQIIAGRKEWEARVRAEQAAAFGVNTSYSVADFGGCR